MKKYSLTLVIALFVLLAACTGRYEGEYAYIDIDVEDFDISTGYAIAFPKGSSLTDAFDLVIEQMIEDGTLACLEDYYVNKENQSCYDSIDFENKVYDIDFDGKGQELKTLTSSGYDPFEILDEKGHLAGFDIDLGNFIAKELNYTLKWEDVDFDTIIIELAENNSDLAIAAITPDDDRRKNVDFSLEYFFESYTVALFRKDDNIQSIDDMKNLIVAAQGGTVQSSLIDTLKERGLVKDNQDVDFPATAMQLLKTNKIDVFFVERSVAEELIAKNNK